MSYKVESTLGEIEFLMEKKYIAKRNSLPKDEYIALLVQIKALYEDLASLYMNEDKQLFVYQTLLRSAYILFEMCELASDKIENHQLYTLCDRLIRLSIDCYDLDINRNAFVVIGRLYYYLKNYFAAEEYIQKAFDDYDYSISTFQLYMKVLDKQYKYKKMLGLMKDFINMGSGFHDKCFIEDFLMPNILHSSYALSYKSLFS